MSNKPVKRNDIKAVTVETLLEEKAELQQRVAELEERNEKLMTDKLKQETTIITVKNAKAKADERLIKLKGELERIKEEAKSCPGLMQMVVNAINEHK